MPPSWDYAVEPFENDSFSKFLKIDSTKHEGMNLVAKYYKVEQDWNDYKNSNGMDDTRSGKYFNLLMIVKTKSDADNVWVSFIEGLH